jgi:hypothetical protein
MRREDSYNRHFHHEIERAEPTNVVAPPVSRGSQAMSAPAWRHETAHIGPAPAAAAPGGWSHSSAAAPARSGGGGFSGAASHSGGGAPMGGGGGHASAGGGGGGHSGSGRPPH